jgi:hypothetical protein
MCCMFQYGGLLQRLLFLLQKLHRAIVYFKLFVFQEVNNLRSCQNYWPIAMRCKRTDGTMVIKSRVEAHACTYASAFYLAFVVDFGRYGIPAQQGHGCIGKAVNPAFVDGVRNGVGVNGSRQRFLNTNLHGRAIDAKNLPLIDTKPIL